MTSSRRNASARQWYEELNGCEIGQGFLYSCWSMIPWDRQLEFVISAAGSAYCVHWGCTAVYAYCLFERPSSLKALTRANSE